MNPLAPKSEPPTSNSIKIYARIQKTGKTARNGGFSAFIVLVLKCLPHFGFQMRVK
jgi:hypothetical protein